MRIRPFCAENPLSRLEVGEWESGVSHEPKVVEELPGRTELWLKLLRRVTREFPQWSMWKGADSPFQRHGDVDSFAPSRDWPAIQNVFREWVRDNGMGPSIICRHVPQGPHFVTLQPDTPYLVQFDVKVRATFRGCTLIAVDDLATLGEMDERGFRRIRPGAEGIIKLLCNGMRRGGEMDPEGLAKKQVVELLRSDPEGVRLATKLVGRAGSALETGIEAVLAGGWDREAMRRVERWAYLKALTEPGVALSRVWFARGPLQTCPVLRIIRRDDRRVPEDRDAWLREVAAGHEVYLDRPGEPLAKERHVL